MIIAHPSSKKPRIEKDLFGQLHVYVSEPALEQRSNLAIVEALAKHFHVKRYQVQIIQGRTSKNKLIEIQE